MFTVDGVQWNIPCDIKRKADIRQSDVSGYMLDRTYYNDVIGVYLSYEITLVPNPARMQDYYALYEVLTQTVGEHTFTVPYNNTTKQIKARISNLSDVYVRPKGNGPTVWKGTRFTITSNEPKE